MISISHWGMHMEPMFREEPGHSWLDRGDGLPVFYDRERERANLKKWMEQGYRLNNDWANQAYLKVTYRD